MEAVVVGRNCRPLWRHNGISGSCVAGHRSSYPSCRQRDISSCSSRFSVSPRSNGYSLISRQQSKSLVSVSKRRLHKVHSASTSPSSLCPFSKQTSLVELPTSTASFDNDLSPLEVHAEQKIEANRNEYSLEEVAKHSSHDDCWVIVRDKVYDVTSFVKEHPGGSLIFSGAGMSVWMYAFEKTTSMTET